MSLSQTTQDIIAFNVKLINFANFAQGSGMQGSFTDLQDALAAAGITITGLQTGMGEALIKTEGTKFVNVLTKWNNILIMFAKHDDPTYVPPVVDPVAP